jgi:hypothetical protein
MEMVSCQECPGGGQRVKIVLSFGLVALALFSALCVVVGQRVAPRIEQSLGIDQPVERSFAPGGVSYDELRNAPLNSVPVNESAAREIKRQDVYCPPCAQVRSPGFTRFVNYAEPITQASSPAPQPATPRQQVTVTSTPWANKYSLAVFVGTDQASQRLLDWVNRDPQLSDLRKNVNFQAYTKDNPLYRERFGGVVPTDQFPAVVFTDSRGGHVYVAGAASLPSSASGLYAALKESTQIQQQATQPAQDPSFPMAEEFDPSCPDGNCPPGRVPLLNPERERLFPNLRPKDQDPIQSLLYWIWNPGEAILAGLCAIAFLVLLFVVAIKVLRS